MADDRGTKVPGIAGANAIGEKYPSVSAISGTRNFQGNGDAQLVTRLCECPNVVFPFGFVEIDG